MQSFLGLLVPVGTIAVGGGFVIVNSFLNEYRITSYQVLSGQFFAAGVTLVGAALLGAILDIVVGHISVALFSKKKLPRPRLLKNLRWGWIGCAILALPISLIFSALGGTNAGVLVFSLVMFSCIVGIILDIIWREIQPNPKSTRERKKLKTEDIVALVILSFLYAVIAGYLYGITLYRHVPRYIGGGMPLSINISVTTSNGVVAGLNFENGLSEPLCHLADFANGIIVYSPNQDRTFQIQSSQISAMVIQGEPLDCSPPRNQPRIETSLSPSNMADKQT